MKYTKTIKVWLSIATIFIYSDLARAERVMSGIKSLTEWVSKAGASLSILAFVVAGLMYFVNRQVGSEKLGGAITGTIIVGSATGLSSILLGFFS